MRAAFASLVALALAAGCTTTEPPAAPTGTTAPTTATAAATSVPTVTATEGAGSREVAAPGETPPPAAAEASPTALPNTSTPSPSKSTRQQEPDRQQVLRWEDSKTTADLEEGRWYLAEIDQDGVRAKSLVMVTPDDRLTTSYQCIVVGEGGLGSGPVVSVVPVGAAGGSVVVHPAASASATRLANDALMGFPLAGFLQSSRPEGASGVCGWAHSPAAGGLVLDTLVRGRATSEST